MKKEDKERLITELRSEYLKSLENDSTIGFYQNLAILGAIISFLVFVKALGPEDFNPFTLFVGFLILIYFTYRNQQYSKYIDDLYEDLLKAVKDDKLFEFKINGRNWFERNIFYKQRYKIV